MVLAEVQAKFLVFRGDPQSYYDINQLENDIGPDKAEPDRHNRQDCLFAELGRIPV